MRIGVDAHVLSGNKMGRLGVAMIEPVGGHGGMNYYDFGLCQGLAQFDVDVALYTCDKTKVLPALNFEVHTKFKGIYGQDPKWRRAVRFFAGLGKSLVHARRNRKSIAHFHIFQITILEWLAVRLFKLAGFRIVITVHDVESFGYDERVKRVRSLYTLADRIIAHNQVSKTELVERLRIENSAISVIPHGHYVDTIMERLSKEEARKKLGLNKSDRLLLFFGQIKKVKGLETLLRALPQVQKVFPNVKLLIAGKLWNNDFRMYDSIIEELGIAPLIIRHIRYIPVEAVDSYFSSADLIVLPYKKIYQSGVLLQSMSYKRPVMVSNIEGMLEIVSDGENGYVFEEGNPESLASRIIEALSDDEFRAQTSEVGYHSVVKNHNWRRIGQLTTRLYQDLLH
ncbi:glycosyltransferase family 4 protein [Cohnella fermenti]|uniref:Glycosyltransferase family 4 protein n=1 Tax=Cohnella fermenti TaxID=2565925 RepID=A0A4S4BJF0_9BACL|nr:glycosyltransferase family 4 protein [Cohnella fermenti]THF74694.1 glycosyltransferase family 4 protein [Cohnella fermenti]